jgi:hypothetical protein
MATPRRRHRRGNVLVLVTLAATALLGTGATVVDVGVGYAERARLQAAADAAAQAAATHLPPPADVAAAKAAAIAWAAKNGAPTSMANVAVWDRPGGGKAVTVRCETTVQTGLARIFGIESFPISAVASVAVAPVNDMPKGWLPIAVPAYREKYANPGDPRGGPNDWFVMSSPSGGYALLTAEPAKGGPTRLVLKSEDGHGGNFQALSIGGSGANVYRANLVNGVPAGLALPSTVDTEPGKMAGPTAQGLKARLEQGEDGRRVLVPLIDRADWETSRGRSEVRLIGYAAARLDGIDPVTHQVVATFTNRLVAAKADRHASSLSPGVYAPIFIPTP